MVTHSRRRGWPLPTLDRQLDAMSDGQLARLVLSNEFDAHALAVAQKQAAGRPLSSGEQRFVETTEKAGSASLFFNQQVMNLLAAAE